MATTTYDVGVVLHRLGIEVLRTRGSRLWAHCPRAGDKRFHATDDRDPSWFIRASGEHAGQQHCFSCKMSGGLADLVAYKLGLEDTFLDPAWRQARKWLDGLVVRTNHVPGNVRVVPARVYAREFALPPEVIFEPLASWPSPMRKYLRRTRHVPAWQVERWGIGYAVDGRLAGRVVLVTRDEDGRPVNYRARSIGSGMKHLGPKSADDPDKRVLFGEHLWPADRAGRTLVLAEGGFNILAVERAARADSRMVDWCFGAMSGSHVHPETLARITGFGRYVVATDNDAAGGAARTKIIAALARHARVTWAEFPDGEDADSMEDSMPGELVHVLARAAYGRRRLRSVGPGIVTPRVLVLGHGRPPR